MARGERASGAGVVLATLVLAIAALVVLVVLASSGEGGSRPAAEPPPAPAESTPPDRVVRPDGTDAGECRPDAPCRTLTFADGVARPGDVVEIGAGVYGAQELTAHHGTEGSAAVVYRPAADARVELEYVTVTGTGVELQDLATGGWSVTRPARAVTLRRIDARGAVFITSAHQVRVIGGSVGPGDSKDSQIKAEDTEGAPVPTDILIDGVDFHDWTRKVDPDAHVECLQVGGVRRLVIRNSRFRNCATHDVFLRSWGGSAVIDDVSIENNWFGASPEGFYAVRVSPTTGVVYDGIELRYNTALQSLLVDEGAARDVSFVGNVAPRGAHTCFADQTFRHNTWQGASCSDTDQDAALDLVDPDRLDLRLADGAAAIDAGDPSDFPARDRVGTPRPRGTAPDAGASEH
jgi:hypothetical protein